MLWQYRKQGEIFRVHRAPVIASTGVTDITADSWNALFLGDFTASPWVGTASGGSSGSKNMAEATNPPTQGAVQNGFHPPAFNGTNQQLLNATTLANWLAAGTGGYLAFCLYFSAATGGVNTLSTAANNPHAWCDSAGYSGCGFSNAGGEKVQLWHYDGAYKGNEHGHSLNTYNLAMWRYDGSNIRSQLNSGSVVVSGAAGAIQVTTGTQKMGVRFDGVVFWQGRILAYGAMPAPQSDAYFATIKAYLNNRYGLAL